MKILLAALVPSLVFFFTMVSLSNATHTTPIKINPHAQTFSAKVTSLNVTPVAEPVIVAKPDYTEQEVKCLADNIYFEARNQSVLGQNAVAWVTMNRVKHKRWPDSVCQVVWQRKQFSWTHDGKSDNPKNKLAYSIAVLIAKDTLREARNNGKDLSKGALYYHADYVNPFWNESLNQVAVVDRHIFYK